MAKNPIFDRAELKPWHCGRKRKIDGSLCQGRSIKGTGDHGPCQAHGGMAPQVRAAAARRVNDTELRVAIKERMIIGSEPITDPFVELRRLAGEAVTWKDKLGAMVDDLAGTYAEETAFGKQIDATVRLFRAAMNDCANLLGMMAKLNIDERQLKLDEATVQLIFRAIEEGLKAAGVSGPAAMEAKRRAAQVVKTDIALVA
jgi:hypothetical protein